MYNVFSRWSQRGTSGCTLSRYIHSHTSTVRMVSGRSSKIYFMICSFAFIEDREPTYICSIWCSHHHMTHDARVRIIFRIDSVRFYDESIQLFMCATKAEEIFAKFRQMIQHNNGNLKHGDTLTWNSLE